MVGCWHELPCDLLLSIAERLPSRSRGDVVRLGAVCKPWSEALAGFRPAAHYYFPWLGLWTPRRSNEVAFFCSKSYRIHRFPKPGCSRIVGCRDGWFVAVDESLGAYIFNPITGDHANLPSFSTLPGRFTWSHVVKRVAMSSTPSSSAATDIFAAAVYSTEEEEEEVQSIVFAKVGDDSWSSSIHLPSCITDIVYYHDAFFVLYAGCQYQIFDPHGPEPKLTLSYLTKTVFQPELDFYKLAVLPASGDLLMIGTERVQYDFRKKRLVVLVFDPEVGSPSARWVETKDLGGRSLFLGSGFIVPVAGASIRKNCIYIFNTYEQTSIPMSIMYVFDMEKGVFGPTLVECPRCNVIHCRFTASSKNMQFPKDMCLSDDDHRQNHHSATNVTTSRIHVLPQAPREEGRRAADGGDGAAKSGIDIGQSSGNDGKDDAAAEEEIDDTDQGSVRRGPSVSVFVAVPVALLVLVLGVGVLRTHWRN